MPLFSIIIPTFNRVQQISQAINSVVQSSFADIEIFVVDDGSTDGTREQIVKDFGESVQYVFQSNKGVCTARNKGAEMATGDYLIFLDSDDQLAPGSLQEYSVILKGKKIKLLLGYIDFIDLNGNKRKRTLPVKNGTQIRHPLTGAFAIDRHLFLEMEGYDENLSFSETSDFFLRLSQNAALSEDEIATVPGAGVLVSEADSKQRRKRYSQKKYESVKYFLTKHKSFLDAQPRHFVNFKRIQGMCALQIKKYAEARECFWEVLKVKPGDWRSYLHFIWVFLTPGLARIYYNR